MQMQYIFHLKKKIVKEFYMNITGQFNDTCILQYKRTYFQIKVVK